MNAPVTAARVWHYQLLPDCFRFLGIIDKIVISISGMVFWWSCVRGVGILFCLGFYMRRHHSILCSWFCKWQADKIWSSNDNRRWRSGYRGGCSPPTSGTCLMHFFLSRLTSCHYWCTWDSCNCCRWDPSHKGGSWAVRVIARLCTGVFMCWNHRRWRAWMRSWSRSSRPIWLTVMISSSLHMCIIAGCLGTRHWHRRWVWLGSWKSCLTIP
jgi:hypothetical protein